MESNIRIVDHSETDIEHLLNNFNVFFTNNYSQYLISNDNPERTLLADSVIIIDEQVYNLYKNNHLFQNIDKKRIIPIIALEHNKTLDSALFIYNKLTELKADKYTQIIAIGGGIICDIASFIAATFYRGTKILLIPTTLLAQCDAAIGGKNGVNFNHIKNAIGTIRQANSIIIDINFLQTLPINHISNGFAEIIKIAAIRDIELFKQLQNIDFPDIFSNVNELNNIIKKAIYNKLQIVAEDENEKGLRRILNFGHTIAHSLESVYGISHGRAVAIGMKYATQFSVNKYQSDTTIIEQMNNILMKFNLIDNNFKIEIDKIFDFIAADKKKEKDILHFVILNKIGQAEQVKIKLNELKEELNALHNN